MPKISEKNNNDDVDLSKAISHFRKPFVLSALHEVSGDIPLKLCMQGTQDETLSKMSNKYSISRLIKAAQNTMFQHRWMTAKMWADLINHYYPSNDSKLIEAGSKLRGSIRRTQRFSDIVLGNGQVINEVSMYH